MPHVEFDDNNYPKIEKGLQVTYRDTHLITDDPTNNAGQRREVSAADHEWIYTGAVGGGSPVGSVPRSQFWNYFEPTKPSAYPEIKPGLVVVYRQKHWATGDQTTHSGQQRQVYSAGDTYVNTDNGHGKNLGAFTRSEFWLYFEPLSVDNAHDGPAVSSESAAHDPDASLKPPLGDSEPVEIVAEVVAPEEAKKSESDAIADSLRAWWLDVASQEVEPLIAKMFEYGGTGRSNDLVRIGESLASAGVGGPEASYTEQALAELGIYFYIEGKMARWSAAIAEGRLVSDDTLLDIGIYIRMVQRIRAVGGWPV